VHFGFNCSQPRVTCAQSLREGSAALGRLPREVQKQVEGHRRAGGVQHLIDLLRQIQVCCYCRIWTAG